MRKAVAAAGRLGHGGGMTVASPSFSLARRLERGADRLIAALVGPEAGQVPHLHLSVVANGDLVLDRCAGTARADGRPLEPDALYRIASMSKPLVIAAFRVLVEQGRIAPETPVAELVPEMAAPRVWTGEPGDPLPTRPATRPMRMIDLLRHSAGLSYGFHRQTPLDALYAAAGLDDYHRRRGSDAYVAALAAMPLAFDPGTGFRYSLSIDLLGIVLERLTGEPLDHVLNRLVLAPLGMVDTAFRLAPDKVERLTDAWTRGVDGAPILYDRGAHSRWHMARKSWSAGGGLLSSMADYRRFLAMLMAGGCGPDGRRLLSPQSVVTMLSNHLPGGGDLAAAGSPPLSETGLAGVGMGLGGAVLLDPRRAGEKGAAGSYYWGGILSTGFFLDPARSLYGVAMAQVLPSTATRLREDFRAMVEGAWEDDKGTSR